ncbi:MAG TPA: LLM class flavin-dependent oxidoreductase [Candidatus Dormibacteraeota bacterium]
MELAVSIGISPRQPLRSFGEQAAELEAAGVGRLWLIDSQLAMKDVYAGLAVAALHTERMLLGTGVTNPLTRHPTVTATSIAAISELSGGRAVLGVGAGDSAVYGIGARPAKVAQMDEVLRFWRAVLSGGEGEWEGRSYRLPHLAAPVKLYLAVSQPRMCALAGRLADGAIVMGPSTPEFVRHQVGWIEDGLREAGRDRGEVDICLMTTLAENVEDVRSWASTEARLLADFAELPAGLEPYAEEIRRAKEEYDFSQHLSIHAGHQGAVSDGLARALAVSGSAEECTSRLRELRACGADGFIFPLLGGGRLERLGFIRDQVLAGL